MTVPCPESEDIWRLVTITSTVFWGSRVADIEEERVVTVTTGDWKKGVS